MKEEVASFKLAWFSDGPGHLWPHNPLPLHEWHGPSEKQDNFNPATETVSKVSNPDPNIHYVSDTSAFIIKVTLSYKLNNAHLYFCKF